MRRSVMFVLCLLASLRVLGAQPSGGLPLSYYLPADAAFDPAIPTPQQFFGFQVGEWHLQPEQIHAYFRALAERSPRVTLETMGKTHEQKEIMLAVFSSPANQGRMSSIRSAHLVLSDPSRSSSADLSSMPVVVWMGYSVHGNEASGSNASVLVAYYLAAAQGTEIDDLLGNAVVLINPSINPDGLNRFASWVNANKGMAVDPSPVSREHREPWPGGRTNHYWFDLNRDWMPLQHPESRARIQKYYEWRPNVLTDHHEMGASATFFFQPGIPSRNNPLVPSTVGDLTEKIAVHHASALDSIGSLYYSGESFDDFYIGKGSSYPDITGGIGILFEQASARGHAQQTSAGVLTFPFAIRNQVTTSFSTLRAAVRLRTELLGHQRDMARSALTLAERSRVQAYVFGSGSDAARTRALAEVLRGHSIDVFGLAKEITAGSDVFRPGEAFIVPVRQVQYRILTSLFERRTEFDDSLFYDVSSWSLPLAFGLPYAELRTAGTGMLGERYESGAASLDKELPGAAGYYAFEWDEFFAPRALERLFAAKIVPRMAFEAFRAMTTDGEHAFRPGSVVLQPGPEADGEVRARAVLRAIAGQDGIHVYGIVSGRSTDGIDMGSPMMRVLERPSIALAAGPGVSPTDAGEVWHLFDARYGKAVTLIDPDDLRGSVLQNFNVLILPGGRYSGIDSQHTAGIREWIADGNTLIALESAVSWAVAGKLVGSKVRPVIGPDKDTATTVAYGDESTLRDARRVPGAIVSAKADLTHPLFFGFRTDDLALFKSTPIVFEASHLRSMTPVTYTQTPLLNGYLHKTSLNTIAGGAAVSVSSYGRGKVVAIADNAAFRAYWWGTSRMLSNAVYLAPHINAPASGE